jgi:hypothetical protein
VRFRSTANWVAEVAIGLDRGAAGAQALTAREMPRATLGLAEIAERELREACIVCFNVF